MTPPPPRSSPTDPLCPYTTRCRAENAHKKIEHWGQDHPSQQLDNDQCWAIFTEAATEVGPALFFSLLIITLSFVPIFTLQGQEGRLFAPLAFTKTYAM